MSTTPNAAYSAVQVIQGAAKPYVKRLLRWICPEKRVANRYCDPPLIAYLGTVRGSSEFKIGDFSVGGFYMITAERWLPGTSFPVTLERIDPDGLGRKLTVTATVVRTGPDGVGFSFVPPPVDDGNASENNGAAVLDFTGLAAFLSGLTLAPADDGSLVRAS